MHDLLADADPMSFTPHGSRKLASTLVSDTGAFACMNEASVRIDGDIAQANRLGVESTPVFMLGAVGDGKTMKPSIRINGAQPLDVFV